MQSKQKDVLSFFFDYKKAPNKPTPGRLAHGEHFSIFNEKHAEEAAAVYNELLSLESYDEFKERIKKFQHELNEGVFMHAISVATLHHKQTAGVHLPPLWEINPAGFFPQPTISRAKRALPNLEVQKPAKDSDPEFQLAWWREDVGLNAHHAHWHMAYPYDFDKDRQGELFYYMHQQMLARYDAERLAVGLSRVDPYDMNGPIQEGYDSHLTNHSGDHLYVPRPTNINLEERWKKATSKNPVEQQQHYYQSLLEAVKSGQFAKDDKTKNEVTIDSLGTIVEARSSSPYKSLYGSIHNKGHNLVAEVMDPDNSDSKKTGVMGDEKTACRDPIFYRWHKFIDSIFVAHKLTLDPYNKEDLHLDYVTITSARVQVISSDEKDTLYTRMENLHVDTSNDIFLLTEKQEKSATVARVNFDKFEYKLDITSTIAMKAAIRIFLAPRLGDHGKRFTLNEQRRLYIEMDKFVVDLVQGGTSISRHSADSSVIKPLDLTCAELIDTEALERATGTCSCDKQTRYCECGLPSHMLLPRGTNAGMKFDLFVMVTDWENDSVDNLDKGSSYCGVRDESYPDKRSMGFPFDRKIKLPGVENGDKHESFIDDFVKHYPNMFTTTLTIKYSTA